MADINGYSSTLAEDVQDAIFKQGTDLGAASFYCALFTTMPAVDGSGYVEPAAIDNYARVQVTTTAWDNAGTSAEVTKTQNANEQIAFNEAQGAGWGLIVGFGLFDVAAIGTGDLRIGGPLTTPKTIAASTIPVFLQNNLSVSTSNQ